MKPHAATRTPDGACPTPQGLRAYGSGSLDADERTSISTHVDGCARCRAEMSSLLRGAPSELGRYRVDAVLGSGGMGIVYRAWDPQLARPVAIKVLRRTSADGEARARLVREAQALAKLSHPNVCHVYDVGSEGDEVWVAMQLVEGVTLREWVAAGAPSSAALLEVLIGAAEGIAAAHDAGLVHRDVKPENVLVTPQGRPIVMDFGLARPGTAIDPLAATITSDTNLTRTGVIAGTPAYLAPEQMTGDTIDGRTDQFAWAVMAWELLVGARPFPAIAGARLEAIRHGLTPPASMPRELGAVLAKAMSEVMRDRHASMRVLIDAVLASAPRPNQARPRGRRAAAVGAAVVGVAAVTFAIWPKRDDGTRAPRTAAARVDDPRLTSTRDHGPFPVAPGSATAPGSAAAPEAAVAPAAVAPSPSSAARTVATPSPSVGATSGSARVATTRPKPTPTPAQPSMSSGMDPQQVQHAIQAIPARRRYKRGGAYGMLDAFCTIPIDPGDVPAGKKLHYVDWGKVTKVEDEPGTFDGDPIQKTMITLQGQRATYRFDDDTLTGQLVTQVGALLAVCLDNDDNNLYRLKNGPIDVPRSVLTLSAPPRFAEIAKYRPAHKSEIGLVAGLIKDPIKFDPAAVFVAQIELKGHDGKYFEVDRFWLEVPSGIPGAKLATSGARVWVVVSKARREDDGHGGTRPVVTALHVLDELLP